MSDTAAAEVRALLDRINRTWLERRPADLAPLFHPQLTIVFPGFTGRAEGREAMIAGSRIFAPTRRSTNTTRRIIRSETRGLFTAPDA
jgi:uncharacterized protein (TIGR02246 family)